MSKLGMVRVVRVREVMTEAVVFLKGSMAVDEAAHILVRHRIHGAPVLGDKGRILGVVSLSDLLGSGSGGSVAERTTRVVYAVRVDDPAIVAVRLMVAEDVHRALVVNEDATIAGIVAPMDILKALAEGLPVGTLPEGEQLEFFDLRSSEEEDE